MKLSLFRGILSFIRKEVVKLKVSQNRENERKQQKGSCFVQRITAFSFMASPLNNANILPSLLQWVSAKTTSEGHWNRWGVKHIHVHTDIHTHTPSATHCVGAHCMRSAASESRRQAWFSVTRIVIINQKPLNEGKTDREMLLCSRVCGTRVWWSEVSEWSYIQSWQREREKTRGYEVKHRRRILAHKCCRGSNTPGMVKSWRRAGEKEEGRRIKRWGEGIGKENNKEKRGQQGYAIFYSNGHWIRILYTRIQNI